MLQRAPSGGTISALSVQLPAVEKLAPYIQPAGSRIFDLGFGSGVMIGMFLLVAGEGSKVIGVDLADKVPVATSNLRAPTEEGQLPVGPFSLEQFSLLGGDAFRYLAKWEQNKEERFDVVYAGCSFDPHTDQLRLFLRRLKPGGAAVFNLGTPGTQGMYFVADEGRTCELLMRVNFMMAESIATPYKAEQSVPLDPSALGAWIRENVYNKQPPEL